MYPPVVWSTPLGLPVEPEVYRMKSGCSDSTHSMSHAGLALVRAQPLQHNLPLDGDALNNLSRPTGDGVQIDKFLAAHHAIGGDNNLRFCVLEPIGQRLRGEAAKDDRVNCADARAGEHRNRQLRHHGHEERDAITLLNSSVLERAGQPLDGVERLLVRPRG
eukprot:scaffold273837_cov27-Tisochrysis_lutea.AAC.4